MNLRKRKKQFRNNNEALLWLKSISDWSKVKTYPSIRKHFMRFDNKKLKDFE